MENMSINQFVLLVKEMRKAQKDFFKKNSILVAVGSDAERVNLEKKVDKAISDRDKRLFEEEVDNQNSLF